MLHSDIKVLLLDISGVIYQGDNLIEGAVQAIIRARERGLIIRFVTNTVSKSTLQLLDELHGMGVQISEAELYTAPLAVQQFVDNRGMHPYCLLPSAISHQFRCYAPEVADAVLLGDARERLNYETLNHAFRICQKGAPLIAIGMNRYFMGRHGLQLDAGPFVKAVEWAADIKADVMGKPDRCFFHQAVASTGCKPSECLMVGDDVDADVLGALQAGLSAVLVRTSQGMS